MTCNRDMPAMPAARERDIEIYDDIPSGLTKREYYAGLAMQSIIASKHEEIKWWSDECKQQSFAHSAVAYADALLAELENTNDL